MRTRQLSTLLLCAALLGCARDATITRGADSDRHWTRRLEAAVPVGTPLDSARATMERNGFRCESNPTAVEALWCEKTSSARLRAVRRHWQAWFTVVDGRVTAVRCETELRRP
jgi:ketosteroid isomerase-like protein